MYQYFLLKKVLNPVNSRKHTVVVFDKFYFTRKSASDVIKLNILLKQKFGYILGSMYDIVQCNNFLYDIYARNTSVYNRLDISYYVSFTNLFIKLSCMPFIITFVLFEIYTLIVIVIKNTLSITLFQETFAYKHLLRKSNTRLKWT